MGEHGYMVITANLRVAGGEIDLLARTPEGALAVVEVKTRKSGRFAPPAANITAAKLRTLKRLAHAIADYYPNFNVQIDILEIDEERDSIVHTPNITA